MSDIFGAIDKHLANSDISKAELLIARALDERPAEIIHARLLIYRARIHLRHKQAQFSLEDLWRSQQLSPELFSNPAIQQLLADSCLMAFEQSPVGTSDKQNIIQAQKIYQDIICNFPEYDNLGWVYYQQGCAFLMVNKPGDATTAFQNALNSLSQEPALKAYCYERLGFIEFYFKRELKRSLEFLELALAVYPASAAKEWLVSTHLLCGRVLQAQGQEQGAIHCIEASLDIVSKNALLEPRTSAKAFLSAGELFANFDQQERKALNYLQAFLKISPTPQGIDVTWSHVHEIIGDLHLQLKQYKEAGDAYATALTFNPHHPWEASIYYRAAQCHYQQGHYAVSIKLIRQLLASAQLEASPVTDYRVYDILGNAQFALAQYEAAKASYQTALQLAPGTAEGLEKIKLYYHFSQQLAEENQSAMT